MPKTPILRLKKQLAEYDNIINFPAEEIEPLRKAVNKIILAIQTSRNSG